MAAHLRIGQAPANLGRIRRRLTGEHDHRALHLIEHAPHAPLHDDPVARQFTAAESPLEQLAIKTRFEFVDRHAHGRLRAAGVNGGLPDSARFAHRVEEKETP
ncbi:hypothetical protein FHX58_005070 [Paraburkholderia tropica]|nr:hypothetical protein [Paraburkholderia tropica]